MHRMHQKFIDLNNLGIYVVFITYIFSTITCNQLVRYNSNVC